MGVRKTRTTAYCPWSDGMVERTNRTLKTMLNHYTGPGRGDWDCFLQYISSAYRATVHASTGFTPNMLVFGQELTHPVDIVFGLETNLPGDQSPHVSVSTLQGRLQRVWAQAKKALGRAAESQQKFAKKSWQAGRNYQVGDLVYKHHPPASVGKLGPKWIGPFPITRIVDPWVVVLNDGRREYTTNVHNIKPKVEPPY